MSDAFAQFEKRLSSLERKHKALAEGYVARISPDGLITVQPKPKSSGLTVRLVALIFFGVMLFKLITVSLIGEVTYQERLDQLLSGTGFEKATAWILQLDPLTLHVSEYLRGAF